MQAQARSDSRRHLLDLHPEPTAANLTVLLELRDDRLGDVGRHSETDSDAAAVRRIDRRVDATITWPYEIEGRAAGIAAIDQGVDLQKVIEWTGVNVPSTG